MAYFGCFDCFEGIGNVWVSPVAQCGYGYAPKRILVLNRLEEQTGNWRFEAPESENRVAGTVCRLGSAVGFCDRGLPAGYAPIRDSLPMYPGRILFSARVAKG